jgi:hypothetical protein
VSATTDHAPIRAALGRSGRWFTDATGRVVTLHSVNMVHKRPPYEPLSIGFGEQDARLITGWALTPCA